MTILLIALIVSILILYPWIKFDNSSIQLSTKVDIRESISYPPNSDTAFGGVLFYEIPSDTLRYREYKHLEDSLNAIRTTIEHNNKSLFGNGKSFKHIGIRSLADSKNPLIESNELDDILNRTHPDTFQRMGNRPYIANLSKDSSDYYIKEMKNFYKKKDMLFDSLYQVRKKENQQKANYYLTLNNYSLDLDNFQSTKFFLRNGTYNLLFAKWDSTTVSYGDTIKHGHFESKQIAVRYSDSDYKILVPISKKTYQVLNIFYWIFQFIYTFFMVYLLGGLPIKVIYSISKGKAFTASNISIFNLLAWVLLLYALYDSFLPLLLKWYYSAIIPEEFITNTFYDNLSKNIDKIIWAIALFAIAKAFKRGYKLQQEQALTI